MFVPGGQIAGAGLISFGADAVIQKATTGEVNWGKAAIAGGLGLVGGGVGIVVTKSVSRVVGTVVARRAAESAASNLARSTVARETGNAAVIARRFGANLTKDMVGSGVSGATAGTIDYTRERVQNGGPWTAQGFLGSAAGGGTAGIISGGLSPAAGHAATKNLQFGLSAGINTSAGFICATCLGLVTYFRSTHASTYILVGSIALGSLAIAVVSHVVPVMAVTYGSLWAGSGLGFLIGVTLTVGERR